MKIEDIKSMARAWNQVQETAHGKTEAMDPVDAKALKGKHKDRKDKDIDNDGDVDSSDKYLHKRRKAVSKAIGKDTEVEVQTQEGKLPPALQAYMDKKNGKKSDDKKDKEKVEEAATATHKPNNGSPAGEGLSPSAKKELARTTPMPDAVNEPVVDKKTFDTIRASGKKAPMRSNDNAAGEKNIKPSATQVKEDMDKTHTVSIDHMGGHDANAKKHNITLTKTKGTDYSHNASGKKKDLQKYLAKHYDSHDDAKAIHPEVH